MPIRKLFIPFLEVVAAEIVLVILTAAIWALSGHSAKAIEILRIILAVLFVAVPAAIMWLYARRKGEDKTGIILSIVGGLSGVLVSIALFMWLAWSGI